MEIFVDYNVVYYDVSINENIISLTFKRYFCEEDSHNMYTK